MIHFNRRQNFIDRQDPPCTNASSLMGQHIHQISRNEQLSQTLKQMHQDTEHCEHSLDNNNTSFNSNNNWAPDLSQNVSADGINMNEYTYMDSVSVSEPEKFLDENQNENRGVNSLSSSNSSRLKCDPFYNVQERFSEKYDQCSRRAIAPLANRQSSRPDERIHKGSFHQQDSTTLDIGLGDHGLTQNTSPGVQASIGNKHGAPVDLDLSLDTEENSLQPLLRGSQLDNCNENCLGATFEVLQSSQQPCTGMSDDSFWNEQNKGRRSALSSGCPETFVGNSTHSNPDQLKSPLCNDCSHNLVNTLPQREGTERTVSVKFEAQFGKDRVRQNVDCFGKEGGKDWNWLSVTKKDVAMCGAILLLAFGVFHLHGRVDAVERSSTRGCSCVEGSETRDRDAAYSSLQAGYGDVSTHAMEGLGYGLQETLTVDGGDSSNLLMSYLNNKNNRDEKITKIKIPSNEQRKNIPRMQSSNSDFDGFESKGTDQVTSLFKTQGKNRPRNYIFQATLNVSRLGETHTVQGNTTEVRVADGETHNVEGNTTEVRVADGEVDPSTSTVRVGGGLRSRRDTEGKAESNTRKSPTKVTDPKFAGRKRHGGGGGQRDKKRDKLKSNSEVYEARFSETFPYTSNFRSKECVTHPNWDKSIEGCKEEVVKLSHKNSMLPFYLATNETASKHLDHRMLKINDDKPGEFKVNIPGDYLVQLNIYIVVENPDHDHKHFLALYHNGQAKLACHQGGFRCPHTNHDRSNKYKICNIIGVLELNKNDTLDIRTMDWNMMVRMEKQYNTYFRVVLVNRRT